MRVGIDYGREHLDVEVREENRIGVHRQPPALPLADPAAAAREALEHPLGFPALRRALTPDDHVALIVDERTPHLPALLSSLLGRISDFPPHGVVALATGDEGATFKELWRL